jgi:hypothetical protein
MRTLLASLSAVAALAGCAAVPGPYDYGYSGYNGDGYYYDTAPAYYGYFDYNRYYYPGYYGGVVVNRPVVVQGGVQRRATASRDRAVASATPRASSRTFSSNAQRSDRQASRANAKRERERNRVAGTRSVDHGS